MFFFFFFFLSFFILFYWCCCAAADQIDDCLLESDDIVVSPKNGNNIYVLTTKQAKLRTKNKAEHFLKSISTECELVRIPPGLTIKKKIEKEPSIVSITKDKSVIKPVSNTVQQLMPTMPLPLPLPSLPPLPPLPAPAPAPLVPGPPSLPPSAPTPTSASTTTPTPAPLLPQTIPIIISVPSGLSNSLGQTFYNNNNQHFQILNVTALPPTTATISPITTTITPKDSLIGSNISENKNVLLDKSCDTEDIEDDQQQDNDMATNDNDNDNVIDIDDEEEEEDEEEDETENENSNDNNITDDNSRCGNNSAIGTDDDGTVYTTINVLQYGDNYVLDTGNDSYKSAELLQHDNSRLIKTEYIINDYTPQGGTSDATTNERELYACKLCGRRYRWKSTLRRHENVECGGKSPSYECPYCDYKAKQRGNLGVHVRKHHPALPQLKSKRKK